MRSFLFVPADSERKLAKGPSSGPDGLILDLEDSVAADRKKVARDMALAYLKGANRAGPKFPSGVGFRRAFVAFSVLDQNRETIWASGRTNAAGIIVDERGHGLGCLRGLQLMGEPQVPTRQQPPPIWSLAHRKPGGDQRIGGAIK